MEPSVGEPDSRLLLFIMIPYIPLSSGVTRDFVILWPLSGDLIILYGYLGLLIETIVFPSEVIYEEVDNRVDEAKEVYRDLIVWRQIKLKKELNL